MVSKLSVTTRLAGHFLALASILMMVTMMMTTTIAMTLFSPPLLQNASADHGQEIVLTSKDVSFAPVSFGEGNQVKVVVKYAVHDPMIANDLVKGVMKVYSPDGTLLKTSSSPTPFPITDTHGTVTLATTLTDPTIENVVAKISFTNPIKTETISNELPVGIPLIGGAALSGEPQEMTMSEESTPKSGSESEEEASVRPLSEDKLLSTESEMASFTMEEEQQPAELEEIPIIQGKPPISEEICDDGIDNDSDALIDLTDGQCNLESQQEQQQQPILQQEQITGSTPEICEDHLDNDFDGKVDSQDEECIYITSSTSSFPSSGQAQPVTNENPERETEDTEQQPTEDLSEESGVKENSDGEVNKEDDDNDDENGDEDEDPEQESDDDDDD